MLTCGLWPMREGKAGHLKSFTKAKQPTRSQKPKAQTTVVLIVLRVCPTVALENGSDLVCSNFSCLCACFCLKRKLKWRQTQNKCFTPGLCVNIRVWIKWIIVMWSTVTTFWAQVVVLLASGTGAAESCCLAVAAHYLSALIPLSVYY